MYGLDPARIRLFILHCSWVTYLLYILSCLSACWKYAFDLIYKKILSTF
jgi:hypothetical protein